MEVREPSAKYLARRGYKQTEVGAIPVDWAVVRVDQAGTVLGGRQRSPNYVGPMTKYLRVANVFDGFIDTDDVLEMPFSPDEKQRFQLKPGDIVLNEGQSIELVGRSAIYRGVPDECCFQNTLVRFRAKPSTSVGFAQLVFQQYLRTGVFASIALQTTSIAHLGAGRFSALRMPLPPKAEQEAIAEALSDADALIESLEQLLAKKRNLKQGAMQELLTGKKRLPGFSAEWKLRQLRELADIRSGGTPSTAQPQFWEGDVLWCTPTDITALNGHKYLMDTRRKISALGLRASSAEVVPANSIVMTSRATIGECAINRVDVTTNQGFKNFIPLDNVDVEFLYYLLLTQKQGFISLCGGSTFLEIGKAQLSAYEVCVPATKGEQVTIAAILSDMDAEIAALEAKLAKARNLKQGMMQELLTGRIRLI